MKATYYDTILTWIMTPMPPHTLPLSQDECTHLESILEKILSHLTPQDKETDEYKDC